MSRLIPNKPKAASDPDSNGCIESPPFKLSSVSALPIEISKEEVSDDEDADEHDMFMVPEIIDDTGLKKANDGVATAPEKRGRKHNTADREHKKIKRLLRNRVSAQQARERKKVYVNEMEQRARDLQESNSSLEEKISTLINENTMLRKVLISSRPKNENADSKP